MFGDLSFFCLARSYHGLGVGTNELSGLPPYRRFLWVWGRPQIGWRVRALCSVLVLYKRITSSSSCSAGPGGGFDGECAGSAEWTWARRVRRRHKFVLHAMQSVRA